MALNANVLAGLMKSNIEALTNFPTTGQNPIVVDPRVLQAISAAIVTHITGAAQVEPGTFVVFDPDSGTLPVTGEGTIT